MVFRITKRSNDYFIWYLLLDKRPMAFLHCEKAVNWTKLPDRDIYFRSKVNFFILSMKCVRNLCRHSNISEHKVTTESYRLLGNRWDTMKMR